MRKKVTIAIFCLLLQCILFVGCGSVQESSGENAVISHSHEILSPTQEPSSSTREVMEGVDSEGVPPEYLPTPLPDTSIAEDELAELRTTKEAIITIGVTPSSEDNVYQAVTNFNSSQDKYWAVIKVYDELSQLLLELTSNKGPDIYYVGKMNYSALAQSGMFEELTPYLEKSEVLSKNDIVASAWRAGCVEEKYYFVLPRFAPQVMLVPKGTTENGTWSMDDYLALAETYPEGMLSKYLSDLKMLILNDLSLSLDSYVDWEEYTCRFDTEEFIALLECLKSYQKKAYPSLEDYTLAEQFQQKMLLSMQVRLGWNLSMYPYKDMRDSMLEFCEIAGMPNEEGELKYLMDFDEFYGMSVLSQNKEASWRFLEYTLSEEYLTIQHKGGRSHMQMYPSNRKVLEKFLDAELGTGPEAYVGHVNEYTKVKLYEMAEFTEEDKLLFLNILENCYAGRWRENRDTYKIVMEELDYYFQGGKSAEEVANVLQNRMSLYLLECR